MLVIWSIMETEAWMEKQTSVPKEPQWATKSTEPVTTRIAGDLVTGFLEAAQA